MLNVALCVSWFLGQDLVPGVSIPVGDGGCEYRLRLYRNSKPDNLGWIRYRPRDVDQCTVDNFKIDDDQYFNFAIDGEACRATS